MFTVFLYMAAVFGLAFSFFKDRGKTKLVLKKAWKSFERILPSVLSVILMIGLILSVLDERQISRLLGAESGVLGMAVAAVIGSVTLIPGFIAFPLAASLLETGAGYGQIAMFISALMMVGVATIPMEAKYFGKRMTIKRNLAFLMLAVIISCVMGVLMG